MKNKFKFLVVMLPIIIVFGLVGYYNFNIHSSQREFTMKLSQCKEIINDTDTILSPEQTVFVENFEKKNYVDGKYNSQFTSQFIPYLVTKMKKRMKIDDVDAVNKMIVLTRLITINTNGEIDNLRLELINRKNVLEPIASSNQIIDTSNVIDGTSVFKPYKNTKISPLEPSVGMSKLEVEASSWGKPQSKNVTNTADNTSEQWVYSNNEYIYFENGVVTAIQSH